MSLSPDRQLLFGLLALRNGLVDRGRLLAGLQTRARDRSKDLAELLTDAGGLDDERREAVEALVRFQVETHGDAREALATLAIDGPLRDGLAALGDPEVDASLPVAAATATLPDAVGPAAFRAAAEHADGRRFRILRPHAEGNLGTVFVALDLELNREVALKRIREKFADDPASRDRFVLEAEVTGGLEHPGIVPVHGLGTLDDGHPYYAMRFVQGDSFKKVVDAFHKDKAGVARSERALRFPRLLRNFVDVCNAVDYAHSRGVLHRDVKPDNVVVGGRGETFVVDWGLAKALGRSADDSEEGTLTPASERDGSSATRPGQALGTPAYMSPEQARGDLEELGPGSDVYSLGATLYYVLTGRAPFHGAVTMVLKAVEAGAFRRPRTLDAAIDPALEAIVLKAMAMKPEERYASARALADDVERWLADERVEAHREPWTRTLNRWLTRHRTGVTALAAAGLAAFVGLAAVSTVQTGARRTLDAKNAELSLANAGLSAGNAKLAESNAKLVETNEALDLQRKRAEENESQAVEAMKRFKDAVADNPELKNDPKLAPLRKALLKEPLAFFGRLRDRLAAEADVRPEALARLADVARAHTHLMHEIGDRQEAVESSRLTVDVYERLVRGQPDVASYRADLARSRYALASTLRFLGRNDEALTIQRGAVEVFEGLVRDHPENDGFRSELGWACNVLGSQYRETGRGPEASPYFDRAVEIAESLARDHPEVGVYQSDLAMCLANVAGRLNDAGRLDEALATFRRIVEILERLIADHPEDVNSRARLGWGLEALGGTLLGAGRNEEAGAAFRRGVEILDGLALEFPAVSQYRENLGDGLAGLGDALAAAGRVDEARTAFRRAVEILGRQAREHSDVPVYATRLGYVLDRFASMLRRAGLDEEAARVDREADEARPPKAEGE